MTVLVTFHYPGPANKLQWECLPSARVLRLSPVECAALTEHIGQTVTPTTVRSYSRAAVNSSVYHSPSYKRATKANNFTIVHKQSSTKMALGQFSTLFKYPMESWFIHTLEPTPMGLVSVGDATAKEYLESRIVCVQRGPLKAIGAKNILQKCVWCPVGPLGKQCL